VGTANQSALAAMFPGESLRRALGTDSDDDLRQFLSNAGDLDLYWPKIGTYLEPGDRTFTADGKNRLLLVSVGAMLSRYQYPLFVEITGLMRRERILNIGGFAAVSDNAWMELWERAGGAATGGDAGDYVRFVKLTLERLRSKGC